MIFQIIGLLIIIYSYSNYKKAFIYYLAFQLFLSGSITFVQVPGVPLLTVDTALLFWFTALYYLKYKSIISQRSQFPFRKPLLCISLVYTISFVFSAAGMLTAFSQYTYQICSQIVLPMLIWVLFDDIEDERIFLRFLTILYVPICCYALVEFQIGENPLIEYEQSLITDPDRSINGIYGDNDFRGRRIQSVFEHPIGGGVNFALFSILIFTIYYKYPTILKINIIHIFTAIVSVFCVLLSNSRGPILFFIIGMLAFVNLRSRRFKVGFSLATLFVISILPYISQYTDTVLSIFSSSVRKNYVGSDEDMRIGQFLSAFALIKDSPIWGVGFNFYKAQLNGFLVEGLLGLESLWLWAIVQCGILGIISTFYYMCSSLFISIKVYASSTAFWIFAAYWISASLTSFPGMKMGLFYFVIFLFLRHKEYKNNATSY